MFSQNGYEGLQSGSAKLHKWLIPGTNRYFVLRNGSAGFLLAHFILWFHQTIEPLNKKGEVWDEWAYAFRAVRNASDLSNHASGTAVDLNATKHPLGVSGTFGYRINGKLASVRIRLRLLLYKGCIRWGGDYEGRKDEMHFEINRPLHICERVARRLMKTKRGKRILEVNPEQRKVINS